MKAAGREDRRPYSYAEFVTQLREQLNAGGRPPAPPHLGQSAALLWRVADLIADHIDVQAAAQRAHETLAKGGDFRAAMRHLERTLRTQRVLR